MFYVSVDFEIGRRPFFPIGNLQKSPVIEIHTCLCFVALDSAAGAFPIEYVVKTCKIQKIIRNSSKPLNSLKFLDIV